MENRIIGRERERESLLSSLLLVTSFMFEIRSKLMDILLMKICLWRIPSSWGFFKSLAASWSQEETKSVFIFGVGRFWKSVGLLFLSVVGDGGWIRIGRWQEIKKACIARATRECVITMRTVINTIRESLITFQTFACRTIRGEIVFLARFKKEKRKKRRWILNIVVNSSTTSTFFRKRLSVPPLQPRGNNFNEETRKIRVNWGYFPASDTNLHKLSVGTRSRPRIARQRGYLLLTVRTEIRWWKRVREKREKKKKRIINSNPLNHSSHLNGSLELEFSFPSPKLSFVHSREDRAASFSNCKFRVDKLSSRFVTRHSHGWRPVAFEKFLRDTRARFLRFSFVLVWKKWMKLDASQCESLGLVRRIRTKGDNVWSLVPFWNYVQVWIHFWSMIMC